LNYYKIAAFEKDLLCHSITHSINSFSQSTAPVWVKNVGAKSFPSSQKIFYANDFGAVSDTSTVNTKAIQKAIDECAAKAAVLLL
jgi:polygalacturonase